MPKYETTRSTTDAAELIEEGLNAIGASGVRRRGRTVYYSARDDDHAQQLLNDAYDEAVYRSVPGLRR